MPFTKQDLANYPISFCRKDEVSVIVGPCSAMAWKERTIPLDGRKYHTGGVVTFKNGLFFRASFSVDTTTFRFVSSESIYLHIGDDWYHLNKPEMLARLQAPRLCDLAMGCPPPPPARPLFPSAPIISPAP